MVRLLRCLVLAQSTPKLHHKEAKRRFIVSIAVMSTVKTTHFSGIWDTMSMRLIKTPFTATSFNPIKTGAGL